MDQEYERIRFCTIKHNSTTYKVDDTYSNIAYMNPVIAQVMLKKNKDTFKYIC